jgi:hypothetical protein
MSRRTPTLKDRAELYAAKHAHADFPYGGKDPVRFIVAKSWRDGYLAAVRDRAKRR